MNRRATMPVAALASAAALLLTACGSGGSEDSPSDQIKGAGKAGSPSATTSEPTDVAGRPKVKLPKTFQASFETWANSDPKLQAILDHGKEELKASYAAIIEADAQSDAVAFYNSGSALNTARDWIKDFTKDDDTLIGKVRVYAPQVRVSPDGSGTLFYCVDEGKVSTKNRKTGKVTNTPADTAKVFYQIKLAKSDGKPWKNTSVSTTAGGCK